MTVTKMILQREGANPITNPSAHQIQRELRKLRTSGPSAYASMTSEDGSYLQVAGSPAGMLLERRDAETGRHFRAFQDTPVVPFEDGAELIFSAGRIKLQAREWFQVKQIVEIFCAFSLGQNEPDHVHWRDVSSVFTKQSPR